MLRKYSVTLFFLVTLALLTMGLTPAGAAYPDRPIKMIVP